MSGFTAALNRLVCLLRTPIDPFDEAINQNSMDHVTIVYPESEGIGNRKSLLLAAECSGELNEPPLKERIVLGACYPLHLLGAAPGHPRRGDLAAAITDAVLDLRTPADQRPEKSVKSPSNL